MSVRDLAKRVAELEERILHLEEKLEHPRRRRPRCTKAMPQCMGMAARFQCTCDAQEWAEPSRRRGREKEE